MVVPLTHLADALREAGLRVTASRIAVFEAVSALPHSTADAVEAAVRAKLGAASTQGVYDALRVLSEQGLLRRIEPAGSAVRYETRTGDNHHHAVCRVCGTVSDVDCATGETPCLTASEPHGFAFDEAEVTYWGICLSCQLRREPVPSTSARYGVVHQKEESA
jgi:Fe2+ or Zn2+ uptake regulation protein